MIRNVRRATIVSPGTWGVPRGGKKHVTEILADGAWRGRRCFILGGGPSLRGFDFNRLKGERVIVVNRMFEAVPFADIMISMDQRFYRWVITGALGAITRANFASFSGIKLFVDIMNATYGPDVYYVRGLTSPQFPTSLKMGVYHGTNSGYAALQIAICLGASPVYLLGYDMKHENGKSHSHVGYPIPQRPTQLDRFRKMFEIQSPVLSRAGVRVVNLNPNSALRCFEFSTFEEVMNGETPDVRPQIETENRVATQVDAS